MWNHQALSLHCWWGSWLIVLMHYGYISLGLHTGFTIMRGARQQPFLWLTSFSPSLHLHVLCMYEGCVCVTWTDSEEMSSLAKWEWLWRNWKKARTNATIWAWRGLHRYTRMCCVGVCMCDSVATDRSHKWVPVDTYISGHVLFSLSMFACELSGANFKSCTIKCIRFSPGGSLFYNHDVYLSLISEQRN